MTSKLVVNTIEADTGISSVSFASSISLSSTSKFHFSAAGIDIDADTNINRPAAGVLAFNINSGEKVRINSDGKVGLGTTGSDYALSIREADNNNKFLMLQKNSGQELLQIREDGSNHIIIDGSHASGELHFYTAGSERIRIDSSGSAIFKGGEGGTDAISVQSEAAGQVLQIANFRGVTDTGDTTRLGVGKNNNILIFTNASGSQVDTFAIGNTDSIPLVFSTANTERLRITSNGSVGIGTDTPVATSKLDVIDGIINVGAAVTTIDTRIQFTRKTTGSFGWIGIPNWDSDGLYIYGPTSNSSEIVARYTSGAWGFFTGGVDTAPRLNIDSSGQFALGRAGQITGNGNSSTSVFEQLSNSNYPLALHSSKTNKRGLMIFYATTGAGNAGDPFIVCTDNTNNKFQVTSDGTITNRGHILPAVNNDKDLGSSSLRWRNVYTTDLQLSNKGKTNDVDNTWGDYTIQEGESDLFLINNRNGKKYKFNLTEVS